MATILIRTVIIYLFISLTLKIMGKRQIGEIQPSELVKVAFIFVGAASLEKLQSNKSLTKFILIN